MANEYLINLLMNGLEEPFQYEVREKDWSRAQRVFDNADMIESRSGFLIFDTVEGLAVAVCLADVQLVRFLYNPVQFPSDQKRGHDEIQVWLRGRKEVVSMFNGDDQDTLAALFVFLDGGTETVAFPGFCDLDGEMVHINVSQMVLITAPLHQVQEGHRELRRDGGQFDDLPDNLSDDIPF
ncbi:hypothetical protein AB833_22955 [Chromatiales bacterium (ex Bugula neritina AB1)]|nr:hypothetical protein AB833_22955 [Chromatiales bacterium (ex Bugula neritina AB1)]